MSEQVQRVNPEVVLDALLTQQARVAGDVLAVASDTWAIHGVIPVDGEVILAEYGSEAEARAVLDSLAAFERHETAENP